MKEIPLTRGQVALVDDEDYEYLNQFKWRAMKDKNTYYARRDITIARYTQSSLYMHRDIMDAPKGMQVDHINHNGLDNRKHNLRFCTNSQNTCNTTTRTGKSKYKGVCWHKASSKWCARIKKDNIETYIGLFDCEKEAAFAYNEAAKELHGEFASLNIL